MTVPNIIILRTVSMERRQPLLGNGRLRLCPRLDGRVPCKDGARGEKNVHAICSPCAEHVFRVVKCQFGKNGAQVFSLLALANLYLARRTLASA
jgi:hypothetical protein